MGAHLLPTFIDQAVLAAEIQRLRATLSLEELEKFGHQEGFCLEESTCLYSADHSLWQTFQSWGRCGWLTDALEIRQQLIGGAEAADDKKLVRAASALGWHLGAFSCGYCNVKPWNEFGLRRCTIIQTANAVRLHENFERTDAERLRSLFADCCQVDDCHSPYHYVTSFDQLLQYAKVLDALLRQAIAAGETLYVLLSI